MTDLKPETHVQYVLGKTRPARQCRRLPVLSGHPSSGACRHGGPRSPVPAPDEARAADLLHAPDGRRIEGLQLVPPDDLAVSLRLIQRGTVKAPTAAVFPVSDAAEAHRYLDRREHARKVLFVAE